MFQALIGFYYYLNLLFSAFHFLKINFMKFILFNYFQKIFLQDFTDY